MSKTDLFSLLEKDHREVKSLLETVIQTCDTHAADGSKMDFATIDQVCKALILHTKIEEKLLYPRAEKERDVVSLIETSYEEHQDIEAVIDELQAQPSSAECLSLCRDLLSQVEAHVALEEKQVFPLLRQHWSQAELNRLGDQCLEMKDQALAGR